MNVTENVSLIMLKKCENSNLRFVLKYLSSRDCSHCGNASKEAIDDDDGF